MFYMMKHKPVMFGTVLLSAAMGLGQTQVQRETLAVQGYPGQATVIRNHGRVLVDVRESQKVL
jgi:hypothetical protein